jgi:uncharacterized spore protein YtfJ
MRTSLLTKAGAGLFGVFFVSFLIGNTAHAECTQIIKTWRVVNGFATGFNAGSAINPDNSGFSQALSAAGAVSGVAAAAIQNRELHLIQDANAQTNSKIVQEFKALLQKAVASKAPEVVLTDYQVFYSVSEANNRDLICSKKFGAMTLKEIAAKIAVSFRFESK